MTYKKLTGAQRKLFQENGYFPIKNALSPKDVKFFKEALEKLDEKKKVIMSKNPFNIGLDCKFIVNEDDTFLKLVDHPATFDYIIDILGPCIQLCMSHALIRPAGNKFQGFLHTDGGQSMQSTYLTKQSQPLQVKIQYFLTDVKHENSGNFIFIPGSHNKPFPTYDKDRGKKTSKVTQYTAKAGDAVIFVNSLWHGATTNQSNSDRKSVIYGYNQLFMRPYDYHVAPKELLDRCTPRQRRLLGDVGTTKPQAFYYAPADQVTLMEGIDLSK